MLIYVVFISALKEDEPSDWELETLSEMLGVSWEKLARRLKFHQGEITGFHKDNEEYSKKALKMLLRWKQKGGAGATYRVLYHALCDKPVERRDLAETFCCKGGLQPPKLPGKLIRKIHEFVLRNILNQNKHTKVKDYLLLTNEGEKTGKKKTEKRQKIVKIHSTVDGCYGNVKHHRHGIDTGNFSLINFRKSQRVGDYSSSCLKVIIRVSQRGHNVPPPPPRLKG